MVARTFQSALALALALAIGCGGASPKPEATRRPIHLTLAALDGGQVGLADYRGRVVVLHLFATWVPAAHLDADQLSAVHRRHPRQVEVIGVALDPDGRAVVAPWRNAVGAPYLITLAPEGLREGQTQLGPIKQLPTTVILDTGGRVAARIDRPLQPQELERLVGRILPGAGTR